VGHAATCALMDLYVARPTLAIVDDDPAVRHALTFAFDAAGINVASFADAESTLRAAGARAWRCLVLDHNLPGMSGLDLLDRLRARGIEAPAILITTNPSIEMRTRAGRSGTEICEKPLLGDRLVERVRVLTA
jgi:two-component system response regulator FixJ